MKAYFARDFAAARAGFAACIKLAGKDTVSEVFITRCEEFEETPAAGKLGRRAPHDAQVARRYPPRATELVFRPPAVRSPRRGETG
ncbi:MAG: hypothetical protein WDO13_13440 [Verrucomicrobiota bacterium]